MGEVQKHEFRTGKGQIVSVADSGLDINHKHFGPTSNRVFNVCYNQQFVISCFLLGLDSNHLFSVLI